MKMQQIAIKEIRVNPLNPRSFERDQDLDDLAKSIKRHGIIEPLIVRKVSADDGIKFELIAGHRRLMAADGVLDTVPCVIREIDAADDGTVLALVENTQRVDLTAYEQAKAVSHALKNGMKQKELATEIGRSQTYVSKFVTITKAAAEIIAKGEDVGYFEDYANVEELYQHARDVLGLNKPAKQEDLELEDELEEGPDNGDGRELNDREALEEEIHARAKAAKVKLDTVKMDEPEAGGFHLLIEFKSIRDAEKFFLASVVSTAK